MAELESIIGSIMSSPESLGRIMEVAKLFGADEKKKEKAPSPIIMGDESNGVDPALLTKALGLLNDYNASDDRRIKLLSAMRPYIKETDSFHIDRAIRIVKLAHVAKNAMESFLG